MSTIRDTGGFERTPFASLLTTCHRSQAEGLLICQREGETRRIHLRDGFPAWATTDSSEHGLGGYLFRRGELAAGDVSLASARLRAEVLGSRADAAALGNARELVLDLFTWQRGSYVLVADAETGDLPDQLPDSFLSLLQDGVSRVTTLERLFEAAGRPESRLLAEQEIPLELRRSLASDAEAVLAAVERGDRPAGAPWAPDVRILQCVWQLRLLGLVQATDLGGGMRLSALLRAPLEPFATPPDPLAELSRIASLPPPPAAVIAPEPPTVPSVSPESQAPPATSESPSIASLFGVTDSNPIAALEATPEGIAQPRLDPPPLTDPDEVAFEMADEDAEPFDVGFEPSFGDDAAMSAPAGPEPALVNDGIPLPIEGLADPFDLDDDSSIDAASLSAALDFDSEGIEAASLSGALDFGSEDMEEFARPAPAPARQVAPPPTVAAHAPPVAARPPVVVVPPAPTPPEPAPRVVVEATTSPASRNDSAVFRLATEELPAPDPVQAAAGARRARSARESMARGGGAQAPQARVVELDPTELDTSAPVHVEPAQAAAEWFQAGERFSHERDMFNAVKSYQEAVKRAPDNIRYRVALATALARNPKWRKEAEEHLQEAATQKPWDVSIQLALARLYRDSKLTKRAVAAYQQVMELDSENVPARKELKAMQASKKEEEANASGLFQRLKTLSQTPLGGAAKEDEEEEVSVG